MSTTLCTFWWIPMKAGFCNPCVILGFFEELLIKIIWILLMAPCPWETAPHELSISKDTYNFGKIFVFLDIERWDSIMHLIGQNSNGPNVNFFIVPWALDEFWWEVERSATKSASEFFFLVDCPPKVTQLDISLCKSIKYMNQNNVFGFDIPM